MNDKVNMRIGPEPLDQIVEHLSCFSCGRNGPFYMRTVYFSSLPVSLFVKVLNMPQTVSLYINCNHVLTDDITNCDFRARQKAHLCVPCIVEHFPRYEHTFNAGVVRLIK